MVTFEKEIELLSKVFNTDNQEWEMRTVPKIADFKELDRSDKSQHKLHFSIIRLFEAAKIDEADIVDGEDVSAEIDSDQLYDLTVKSIKILCVPDPEFTVGDKAEFLNDSGALLKFGLWFLKEKLAPFFSVLMLNSPR